MESSDHQSSNGQGVDLSGIDMAAAGLAMAAHAEAALTASPKSQGERPINPTTLSHWFPLIERAGLPVPRTVIVRGFSDEETYEWMDGNLPASLEAVAASIAAAADSLGGFPCFLRTGHSSGKQEWADTCYLPSRDVIIPHLFRLCEFSCIVDMFGLPCSEFVVRELVSSIAPFTAFNQTPIAREVRFFCEDGRLSAWQPYWPADALRDRNPSREDWAIELAAINRFTDAELGETGALALRAAQVAASGGLCADWSVDVLQTRDRGWLVIDMADAARSYRSADQRSID